jgi:GNAT superfamily N-acetyltransferase
MDGLGQSGALMRSSDANCGELLAAHFAEFFSLFGEAPGSRLCDSDDALLFETAIPSLPYNGVLRFSLEVRVEREVDGVFRRFGQRDVPFFWFVDPAAVAADLPRQLTQRGLALADELSGMVQTLDRLPEAGESPAGIEIREVRGRAEARTFFELVAWRWGVTPDDVEQLMHMNQHFRMGEPGAVARAWLAWRGGEPVAKAVLYTRGTVAGLYGVSTKPEAREMGLGTQLTLAAFDAARAAGCELGVLHSSTMARGLYQRLGFREVTRFPVFAPPAQLHI